ncbi:MAG: tRNA uridine-5-carboxymethylaminomethyl(34) synthesis GTPase MnmE [Gemmatimonas sp.]
MMPPAANSSLLAGGDDTIVAIATPPGRGALATIRVSGDKARRVGEALGATIAEPRAATRVALHHPETGAPLDDAIATLFLAPRSYTGEELLELSVHGGLTVPRGVLAACIAAGCRMALPGEFTRRAVLNGQLDLVQAEAVADLIDARTSAMGRQALAQLDGGLSRRLAALREDLVGLEAMIAYDIDFPGEDDGPIATERITTSAAELLSAIDTLLATAPRAAMLRDGALVVIAGPPNAGKSSLFNALLGDARALVTDVPGTTRDAIEAVLDRQPVPIRLVDTAGLRDTNDPIEKLGIEVSARYLGRASVVLACGASEADVERTVGAILHRTSARVVGVHTKIDLDTRDDMVSAVRVRDDNARNPVYLVSAERGDGLQALLSALDVLLTGDDGNAADEEPVLVTRERHRLALGAARGEIAGFLEAWAGGIVPATVAAVHLQAARDALGDVTGVIALDDVLDRVFRDFCIGK